MIARLFAPVASLVLADVTRKQVYIWLAAQAAELI